MTYYTRLADTSNRWRFEALLTQYISLPIAGDCPQAFILCDTDRCMSKSLQKDGDRNCEDGTDEGDPSTTSSSTVSSTTSSTVSSTTSSTAASVLSSTASSVLSSTASSVVSSTASSVLSSTASSVLSTPASPPLSTTTLLTSATNNTANEMSRFVAGLSGTQLMSAILVPIAIIICTVSSVVCFRRRAHSHYEDPALVPN
ncbi:uncharacterized protein LOC125666153 isoform X2 [Ostrea edulis]|nr:uncharacterized protein LOC125666153 isoform X2 [Ostrea edulis]